MADKVAILAQVVGVEAARTLGCQRGVDPTFAEGTQHGRLTDALAATGRYFGPTLPGGDFEIEDMVEMPARWGTVLRGAGGTSNDIGESHFTNNLQGSKHCSRLIWKGADLGTMLRANSGGFDISNIHFQGCRVAGAGSEPTGGVYPDRAQVGLHINTSSNGAVVGAKCCLHNLSFQQIHTHILIGTDLSGVGTASYTGQDHSHADTVYISQTQHWFPSTGTHAGQGTCVHIRNDQSLGNNFGTISCHGRPEQVVYIERGGKTNIGQILHSGSSGIALRIGFINTNQGNITVNQVNLDAVGGKLLQADAIYNSAIASPNVWIGAASIPPGVTEVPQIDVGPGSYFINCCNYLQAGAVKMTGLTVGGQDRVCHVHLNGCTLYDTNLPGLVDGASSGPYLLTWTNCKRYHNGPATLDWGYLFNDSTSVTEIKNGSWSRLAYDYTP